MIEDRKPLLEAVMLAAFKAKNGVCQTVALTMQPLEEELKR